MAYQEQTFMTIKGLRQLECVKVNDDDRDNRYNVVKSIDCGVLIIHD